MCGMPADFTMRGETLFMYASDHCRIRDSDYFHFMHLRTICFMVF